MHLTLVVPTLNRYDLLAHLLSSVRAGTRVPDKIYVVDNGGMCPDIAGVEVIRPGCNLGCSASWNLGLRLSKDSTIISNDDIEVFPDTVANLEQHGETHALVCCNGEWPGDGQGWSFLLHRPAAVTAVGWYDEAFWPAYCEDSDYCWRLRVHGTPPFIAKDVLLNIKHPFGSSTRALDSKQRALFKSAYTKNTDRYRRKWGGAPRHEVYRHPFNAGV